MAFTPRSIETRLAVAVVLNLRGDSDLMELTKGRIFFGPTFGDDASIKPYQINVAPATELEFLPGIGGYSDSNKGIIIAYYRPFETREIADLEAETCYEHIGRIRARLTAGDDPEGRGMLFDPDADPLTENPVERYINTTYSSIRVVSVTATEKKTAIQHLIAIDYQTREDYEGNRA